MLSHLERIVTEAEFVVAKLSAMAARLVPAAEIHWSLPTPITRVADASNTLNGLGFSALNGSSGKVLGICARAFIAAAEPKRV
jgi:hypothetical protein